MLMIKNHKRINGTERYKENPYIEANIFNSMENVDLDAVIGFKKDGIKHSFLEAY